MSTQLIVLSVFQSDSIFPCDEKYFVAVDQVNWKIVNGLIIEVAARNNLPNLIAITNAKFFVDVSDVDEDGNECMLIAEMHCRMENNVETTFKFLC